MLQEEGRGPVRLFEGRIRTFSADSVPQEDGRGPVRLSVEKSTRVSRAVNVLQEDGREPLMQERINGYSG